MLMSSRVPVLPSAYKLPPLTVAILSMLSLIAFMLLICLLSCLYKVHKRNEKNKKLLLIAQQAGKGDGDAFRQVTLTCSLRWCVHCPPAPHTHTRPLSHQPAPPPVAYSPALVKPVFTGCM